MWINLEKVEQFNKQFVYTIFSGEKKKGFEAEG